MTDRTPPEALRPKFGDLLRNTMTSERNPHRDAYFIRETTLPGGGVNPGRWFEMTDGNGETWLSNPANMIPSPCSAHVQNPAEIEHVAGDVSGNGVEMNTPQQPAPATQQAGVALSDDLRDRLVAISEAVADQDDRAAQAMLREILKAPQPAPTAQTAESVLEDAARWRAWAAGMVEACAAPHGVTPPFMAAFEEAIGDSEACFSVEQLNGWVDAARKQGATK